MNLGQLVYELQNKAGFNDSKYYPRWVQFVNEAIREFSRRQPWAGLEDYVTLKTTGSRFLILPQYVDTIVSLLNVTDSVPIERAGNFDREAPAIMAQNVAGRVYQYEDAGEVPTYADPVGYLWFKSSNSSDTLNVYLTGLVANSGGSGALETVIKHEQISATGSTPVTLTSLFTKIISISKSTDTNGDFYFYDAGATNAQLSFLSKFETDARFKRVQLLFNPSAQTTISLRFRYKIPYLRDDAQAPPPAVKTDFIVNHALSLHYAEQEQNQKAVLQEQKATRVLEAEANKDLNHNEPYTAFTPWLPTLYDRSDDYWREY